ncbi:hypothetical protein MtrunA17_Chr3g0127061 [Medicago truncatula]|uniref:Transmembrane protein n=1 Tax=Medicago truncatula TaxID=3880 RepID=A0A396IVR0_MEDTR|nr:hypothetical protein MtrunA17_Chr3g0127061 [Medicago truncatula]
MLIHLFGCFSFFDCSSLCWFISLVVVSSLVALLFLCLLFDYCSFFG